MMRFFFGPANSLVLTVDPETISRYDLEEALEDIGRYYQFGTLTEASKRRGIAAVVFAQARKRHYLHFVPPLRVLDVPVTIFVHPDCIGVTRLPLREELALYREHFGAFTEVRDLEDHAWSDMSWAKARIAEAREKFGPLPYDRLHPTRFFSRWRDLGDFPPEKLEIGFELPSAIRPEHEAHLRNAIVFATTQAKRPLRWVTGHAATLDDSEVTWLQAEGFTGYLSGLSGPTIRSTSPWRMPRWPLEKTSPEEDPT